MVADARNLFKIQDQGMNRVGVGIMQMEFVAVLLFTLQEGVVFADQFTHIAPESLLQVALNGPRTAPPARQTVTSWFVRPFSGTVMVISLSMNL